MTTKKPSEPKLHERFPDPLDLRIATAWGGAHGRKIDTITHVVLAPRQFIIKSDFDLEDKVLKALPSHGLKVLRRDNHNTVAVEVPADWLPAGEALPENPDKGDDIGTAGPVIQSGDMQITKTRPDGTPEVISFPGGTQGDFAAWIDDQLSKPVIPEPPVDSQDVQPVKTISEPLVYAPNAKPEDFDNLLSLRNTRIAELEARVKKLEAENAEHERGSRGLYQQVQDLMAAEIKLRKEHVVERNEMAKRLEVAQATIDDLRQQLNYALEINERQSEMLKERIPAAQGKVEVETIQQVFGLSFESVLVEAADNLIADYRNDRWQSVSETVNAIAIVDDDHISHIKTIRTIRFERPVQPKPASGDEIRESVAALKRQGMSGPHQAEPLVKAIGQPMTIIHVDPKVPEPTLNSLTADIRARGADAVLADMDTRAFQEASQAANAVCAFLGHKTAYAGPFPALRQPHDSAVSDDR